MAAAAACGGNQGLIPTDVTDPDRYLLERGETELADGDWLDAREYFRQIIDNYPQSTRRAAAKLGVADSFFGEGSAESMVFAANEYNEFLVFYPTHQRADYAQYRLAMTYYEQMRAPERDQSATREALRELQEFLASFPQSSLRPEVEMKWREARSRLSEAEYRIGVQNLRMRAYRGAVSRFEQILEEDPEYPRRDAVYFHLAETYARADNHAEAIPYLERLLAEFPSSERREDAVELLEELKAR